MESSGQSKRAIWIAWECHRRNQSISRKIGVQLFELDENYSFSLRYPVLLWRTVWIIFKKKPQILFVQNPSIILAIFAVYFARLLKIETVVDAHNVGVFFEHRNWFVKKTGQLLNDIVIKKASLVLITNSELSGYIVSKSGNFFVLPDPFPLFEHKEYIPLKGGYNIFYICSFSNDEPYRELIESSKYLNNDTVIYISGNFKNKKLPTDIPPKVVFTGYLPNQKYIDYLHSSDVVVDLTNRENCLVCGAYEAVAANKPQVLSDSKILREYFGNMAVYTDNSPHDIAKKIQLALNQKEKMENDIINYKMTKEKEWDELCNKLFNVIEGA